MQRPRTISRPVPVKVPDPGEIAMDSARWHRVGVFRRLVKTETEAASPAADARPAWIRRAA